MEIINCFGETAPLLQSINEDLLVRNAYWGNVPNLRYYINILFPKFAEVSVGLTNDHGAMDDVFMGALFGVLSQKEILRFEIACDQNLHGNNFKTRRAGLGFDEVKKQYRRYLRNNLKANLIGDNERYDFTIECLDLPGDGTVRAFSLSVNYSEKPKSSTVVPGWFMTARDQACKNKEASWKVFFPEKSPELDLLVAIELWAKSWNDTRDTIEKLGFAMIDQEYFTQRWNYYYTEMIRLISDIPDMQDKVDAYMKSKK